MCSRLISLCPPPQRRNGLLLDTPALSRLSHKRLMAAFQVEAQRGEQDLYRCVTLSPRGASVSNFGELIVRGELTTRLTHQANRASSRHPHAKRRSAHAADTFTRRRCRQNQVKELIQRALSADTEGGGA